MWVTKLRYKSLVRDKEIDDRWTYKQTCFTLSAWCATPKQLKVVKKISVSFCFSFICLPISGKVERCSLERVFLGIKNKITREKNARRKSKTPIRYISHRHYEAPLSSIFDVRPFSSFFPLILTTLVLEALVFDSFTFDRESETCVCP